jgi:hypothetical protein
MLFDSCTLATTRDFSTTLDASHATRRWKLFSTYWQDAASPDAAYPARFGTTYEVFSWQRETCSRSTTTPNRLGAARPSRQRPSPCVKASVQSLCWSLGYYANIATTACLMELSPPLKTLSTRTRRKLPFGQELEHKTSAWSCHKPEMFTEL